MSHIFTGDTVRIRSTFTDFPAENGDPGDVIDPDAELITVTIYSGDMSVIATDEATKSSVGVYYYDWTVPDEVGTYYFEVKGMFDGKPQISRQKYSVKFKPHAS